MDLYQDGVEVLVTYERNICTLDPEKSEIFDLPECPLGHNHCDAECPYCEAISPEPVKNGGKKHERLQRSSSIQA